MNEPTTASFPSPGAREIGVVYLSYLLVGGAGLFLLRGLVRGGDATATANSILAHESVYRAGLSLELVANALYITLAASFCALFMRVNRGVALLAAFFGLAGCIVQICGGVLEVAPLVLLKDRSLLHAVGAEPLSMASLLSLKLYSRTYDISFVLFAFFDLAIGYLIIHSRFLPRILGMLMCAGGVAGATYLWPPLAHPLSPYVLAVGGFAELALLLWLLVKGLDITRWREWAEP